MRAWLPILLLFLSNIAMTFVWYGHLKTERNSPLFPAWYMREKLTLNYLWASCCLVGAVFFTFRR